MSSGLIPDLSWWNYLHWNVTKCQKHNDENTVWWTTACGGSASIFGPLCWTVSAVLLAILLIMIFITCYAIYSYKDENSQLQYQLAETNKTLKSQNEYFTAKLHSQMEDFIKAGEKHRDELLKQQEALKNQQEEHQRLLKEEQEKMKLQNAATPVPVPQPQPIIIPYYPPGRRNSDNDIKGVSRQHNKDSHFEGGRENLNWDQRNPHESQNQFPTDPSRSYETNPRHLSDEVLNASRTDPRTVTLQFSPRKSKDENGNVDGGKENGQSKTDNNLNSSKNQMTSRKDPLEMSKLDFGESAASKLWHSEDPHSVTSSSEYSDSVDSIPPVSLGGHLPQDHPARTLTPIDIMFLVDSSSSIGITNFEVIKKNICNVLDDIDIGPGRSRVALVQYAQEPNVVFGFEKYYSLNNVKRGVHRMSYTGGSTMLAKALSFAAGILYKEQNMKENKRKHKLMPTPRHDRLQILCVVSDGASDDNIDRATYTIHEKLQIKVFAMVSKSFNKDKLIPVTRFEGSIFVMTQKESISLWIWRQQKLWGENYGSYIEREKSMPLSTKRSPKKTAR